MKYIKLFENIENVGKYAIASSETGDAYWHNFYGLIVDTGYHIGMNSNVYDVYLVKILNKLSYEKLIRTKNLKATSNTAIIPKFDYKNTNDTDTFMWLHKKHLTIYDSKKDFEHRVKYLEIEDTANKYNL